MINAIEAAGDSERTAALRAELDLLKDELGWSKYYFYDDYRGNANFDSMSRYVPQERQEQRAIDIMMDNYSDDASGWEDPLYEAVNGNPEAAGYLSNAGASYYGSDNPLGAIYGRVTEDKSEADQMTEYEVAMFNYLYATQGQAAAHEYYYNYLQTSLFSRERAESEAYWQKQARENPVGSSIFSVAVSPMKGLTYLGQATDFLADGELTEDAPYNSFSYIPGTIRETVPENWGAVGTFAYQTGMSMADFLLSTAITGGNQTAALTIMGSGAAADTTLAAKDRGLEDWQAFTLGTVAGLAEALTEKVSLDTLFNADLLADGTLKYILKNAFTEGSEEVASSTVNLIADILVSKEQSEWQQSIDAYVEQGLTEGQAFARAMADQALSLGVDFLGGFVSGGAMGGGGAIIGNYNSGKLGAELETMQLSDADIQEMIETCFEAGQDSVAYKVAKEIQQKIQKSTTLTEQDKARLFQAAAQAQPEAGWERSAAPENVSLPTLGDDGHSTESSAEQMRLQAQSDFRSGKITEAEFDSIMDEVMHLEELEDGTSVKMLVDPDDINTNVNGGNINGNIQTQPGGPAAARSGTDSASQYGANLPDGVQFRNAGQSAGVQDGQMAGGPGRQGSQANSQAKAIIERQNTAGDLRQQGLISATSSIALGIESGTDTENLYVMPQEYYDAELQQAAQFAQAETGLNVAFTVGNIEINRGGRAGKVRGVHTGRQIVAQCDNAKATAMQLVKHEVFHDKVMTDPGLIQQLKEEIRERFEPQEFDAVMDRYIDELWPLYGPEDETAWDEYEGAWNMILEEMLADAYAGINAFSAHAERFETAVNELTPTNIKVEQKSQDNGTAEPTGPPATERFSYAGENANTADMEALARAKEMQAAGVADETIRQQTGWHMGMDGKWRWEIDDSGMQYSGKGDLGLRERRPEYARYRELLDKSNRYVLELSDEALTPEETAELQKLKDIWGGTFRKAGRITEDALPTDLLSDYVKHDDLFEAYPQLRKTRLRFADLPEGTRGQYDPEQDVITLSESLRGKPQDTLIHEIQHVIQKAEGFSRGSSVEYWAAKLVADRQREVELADKKYREIFDSMPEELKAKVRAYNRANLDYDYDEAIAIENELLESEYGELFSAWQDADFKRRNLRERYKDNRFLTEDAITNYWNTAGEIEARDVAARRSLTPEQRRSQEPARGDSYTVFMEDSDELSLQLGEMYSVDDTDGPATIGDLQAELYQLQSQRRSILEADADYAAAAKNLRYANTFTEKVAARKAMAAAAGNIDTTDIDQRIAELNDQISEIRTRETRQHREDQEKYSGTKTAGYSTMPDTRLKDLDQDYMKAVRSGDRARMADLVEQAAEAAMPASVVRDKSGRLLKTYHHTGNRFTVFDRNMARTGTEMDGFFFAPDPDSTSEYGSNVITAYLNITKLAMDPKLDRKFNDSGTLLREKLAYQGYDGMARTENGEIYEYMTFDPEQIKSADPVVYDDRGRVVPLSERFNFRNPDIRYSVDDADASGTNELRENMTTKERDILRGVETRLLRNIGGALSVTKFGDRSYLKSVIRGLSDTYLESGTIEQQAMDDLFEQAYRQGIVVDRELHDQYEEVRKYLHTVSLTLDPRDRSDIADYPDFVKRMRGRMRIVNEGGLPVDSAWHELNDMAPELFPDSIAHPADQLVRMTEVLDSLRIAEKSLSDYYGPMASTYKKDAKAEFERAVWESIGELRQIRRFEQERQQKLQEAEPAPTTPEEAMEAWAKLKTARKTYEKAMAKNLLTTEDEIAVGELLKGKLLPEHLDKDNLNVKGILAVYEAKQEYEHLTKLLAEYRRKVKADIRAEADTYLETANTWKDKDIGLLYSREIMQRNVEDIVPDKKLAKRINERYFEPVRDAEAAAVKMKEEYREAVRKLSLSRNIKKGNLVSEAHAVQLYGEAMDNIRILEKARGRLKHRDGKSLEEWRGVVYKLWQENPGLDKAKIESAVAEMRQIYDELFRKMNEVRVRWGYEPVNYRQGYFPHFQPGDGDGIMTQFGRVLGIDTQVVALPTTINGLTHTFKPGIQWFGNAQERLGFNTAYDAVEGFDRYIEGVASVICQTENIQRLRALASQIRYRTSDEGIRKQVDAIYSNAALTEEQKNDAISGIYEKGRYTLSNFVVEVDEYTNLLANKKSKLDRTVEALIGRKFYTAMKWLESRVGANMIAGNVTSALTNFIPLTQASAQLSKKAMLKGMWDTLASYKTDDGIIDRSAFLTNRRGSDPLVKVWSAKVSEVLGKPMELIDSFTSGSIVRAAYYQNLKQGLSESEAMHQADIFASRVMAERSKGGMPTLFESKNPFFKLFTQFQLEVNNQWSEVFKDIPRSQREKGLGALALVFLQYFLGAWLFNNLYEKWIGRRPAMDPIDIVLDTVKDFASDDVSATDALGNLANNVLEELPFSSALTLVGIETDGGRVPVSSGIPNIPTLVNAATNEDWAPEKRWKEAQDELNKLAYVIPPFGGNQVSKIWKGIKAYIEGGSYSVDSDGNDILQYPVYNDESGDFWGLVQAMLLGKSALPEAKEWVEDGFDSLSAKQTAIYQDMIDSGVSEREAYDLIDSLRSASETEDASKKEAQIDILQNAEASDECKAIAFYGLLATDNERLIMDSLTDSGAMPGPAMDVLIQLRDAAALPSAEEKVAQADILIRSALTESEKEIVIRSWLDDQEVNENGNLTSLGKFNLAMKQGITTEEYLRFRATGMEIDKLLEYTEAGFEASEAQDLAQAIHDLDPLPGEDRVSTLQKWRASVDFSDDVEDQLTALSMIMEPKSLAVWETANNYGVAPDVYVTFQEIGTQYDANGNGSYTQAEAKAAIDAEFSHLTTAQKAVLWQWVCYSSGSKKNPYDPTIGQGFIDARDAAKEAAEE